MHDTAFEIGRRFFELYCGGAELGEARAEILEVGAEIVNGSLRDAAPANVRYTGMDLSPGPGVDVVLNDPTRFPFPNAQFDAVVSSSCLEHDPMFWITFLEMVRVLKEGGFLYVNVPSNGEYHRYPTDNWRFYPDSGLALMKWARRQNHHLFMAESFVARRSADQWNDCVMVFRKDIPAAAGQRRIADTLPPPYNVHRAEDGPIENQSRLTEDMALLLQLRAELESSRAEIARLTTELSRQRQAAATEPVTIGFE